MWNPTLYIGALGITVYRGASSGDDVTGGADDKPFGYNMPGPLSSARESPCQQ